MNQIVFPVKDIHRKQPIKYDWAYKYFNFMPTQLRKQFYQIKFADHQAYFYQGLRYQYGIDRSADPKKALQYYSKSAQLKHPIAIFKLSELIYKTYQQKGNFDDRDEQIYLLYKSFAYNITEQSKDLDCVYDLAVHLDCEHQKLDKIDLLLQKFSKKYALTEMKFVKARMLSRFYTDDDIYRSAIEMLIELVQTEKHLQSAFALARQFKKAEAQLQRLMSQKEIADNCQKYFNYCRKNKYYLAYHQYGRYLLLTNPTNQGLFILHEGYLNKNYACLPNLIFLTFENLDLQNLAFLEGILDLEIINIMRGNLIAILQFMDIYEALKKYVPSYKNQRHDNIRKMVIKIVQQQYKRQNQTKIQDQGILVSAYIDLVVLGEVTKNLSEQLILLKQCRRYINLQTRWLERYILLKEQKIIDRLYQKDSQIRLVAGKKLYQAFLKLQRYNSSSYYNYSKIFKRDGELRLQTSWHIIYFQKVQIGNQKEETHYSSYLYAKQNPNQNQEDIKKVKKLNNGQER